MQEEWDFQYSGSEDDQEESEWEDESESMLEENQALHLQLAAADDEEGVLDDDHAEPEVPVGHLPKELEQFLDSLDV